MYQSLILALLMMAFQNGQQYYQQALVQERAAGNLEAAIQLFQDAARYAGNDRALAAQALMGAARCYEKLGQAKARDVYEEVAKTYSDQQQMAQQARDRMRALQARQNPNAVHTDTGVDVTPEGLGARSWRDPKVIEVAPGMYWYWSGETKWETGKRVQIAGKIVQVHWDNPSISVMVQTSAQDGKSEVYTVKGGAPRTLIQAGLTPASLRLGETISVEGFSTPEADSRTIGMAILTFSDGRRLALGQSVSGK